VANDVKHKDYKTFDGHKTKLNAINTKKDGTLPMCKNCAQYNTEEKIPGCGRCPMVGATKGSKNFVVDGGWCKIYAANKSKLEASQKK
jgi:hypothetical protein